MPHNLTDDGVRQRYGLPPETRIVRLTPDGVGRVRIEPDAFGLVEVESTLERAVWDRQIVVAGGTVRLSVQGAFVGEGSPVRVVLRDGRDRLVGRGTGRMHRDRAVVEVEVDRRAADRDPDGALCAADVELTELGLAVVSAPLLVLPYAELRDARWSEAEARDGDEVELSCRLSGSPAGVEGAGREVADVEVFRGDEGASGGAGGAGLGSVFEPVVTLRVPVVDGRLSARWRVGYDAEGKARIATQMELDAVAERTGAEAERYARPVWRFRVWLAGLVAESGEMGYQDWVELELVDADGAPVADTPYVVYLADGTTREGALGADGRAREDDVPPGPVRIEYSERDESL